MGPGRLVEPFDFQARLMDGTMNTGDTNPRRDGEEPSAPPKLVAALKELPARRVFVPPVVDEAVLAAARRHLSGAPRSLPGLFRVFRLRLAWPALAAACVVLIGFVFFFMKSGRDADLARQDLNHDGQVDILDAFRLAREWQAGARPSGPDLNGDGVVDRRDAELIAAQAVKLQKGGRS
jgi:hypothetical protein